MGGGGDRRSTRYFVPVQSLVSDQIDFTYDFDIHTGWAKSRYTVIVQKKPVKCIPTFGPPCINIHSIYIYIVGLSIKTFITYVYKFIMYV